MCLLDKQIHKLKDKRSHHQNRSKKRTKIGSTVKNNSNKRAKKFKISRSHFGEKRKEVREMLKICQVKVSYQRSPYPEKIMIKKMNCKISRSQPTTKRTKKFIISRLQPLNRPKSS